jgi:hypothetical protein
MRKLTEKQKYDNIIEKIISRIKTIAKEYGVDNTRIACGRYNEAERKKANIAFDIEEKEKELQELKRKSR